MREDYGELIKRMERSGARVVKTRRGWRDYVTRKCVGYTICVAGLVSSAIFGKEALDRSLDLAENFGNERSAIVDAAANFRDYEEIRRDIESTNRSLETYACLGFLGVVVAG